MTKPAYSLIAWGIALSLIDIHIGYFRFAFIGYLLLMRGAYRLGRTNRYYRIALAGSLLQEILACAAAMTGLRMDLPLLSNEVVTVPELLRISASIVALLVTMFGLCSGIQAEAEANGAQPLVQSARSTWIALLAINGASLFLLPFLMNVLKSDAIWFMLLLGAAGFLASARVLFLVRQARRSIQAADVTKL